MKKIRGKGVNFIAVLISAAAVLVLALTGTFAAYTNQGYQKGVVSTTRQETRFSSNLLRQYALTSAEGERAEKEYSLNLFGVSEGNYSAEIRICNFPQEKGNLVNEQEITYDIVFQVVPLNGVTLTEAMYPRINGNAAETQTFRGTLLAGVSTIMKYNVEFPEAAIDKVMVKATATPVEASVGATSNLLLYREIFPIKTKTVEAKEFSCVGSFVDSESIPSTEYHAFNYQIVVQNGKGSAMLKWDSSKLKIDPFFAEDMGKQGIGVNPLPDNENWSFMAFSVDSNVQNVYNIVFYRNDKVENEDWSAIKALTGLSVSVVE